MKKYMLPGLAENSRINIDFIRLLKEHPEYFYDNINVGAVFGNFKFCSWDGGRIFGEGAHLHSSKEEIQMLQNIYNNELNVPMRFVFTNNSLTQEDCYDRFNNLVLELCENGQNEIVINSPILEKYIRENYPNYKFISSTTKCLTNIEEAKSEILNSNYYLTCLDYNLNKNYKFLETLTQEEKNKTELLVNAICGPACPNRKNHYKLNSLYMLNYGKPYALRSCSIEHNNLYPRNDSVFISPEEIDNYYYPNGFTNFKLEGRTFSELDALLNLVRYMVKPEYQFYIISQLMQNK